MKPGPEFRNINSSRCFRAQFDRVFIRVRRRRGLDCSLGLLRRGTSEFEAIERFCHADSMGQLDLSATLRGVGEAQHLVDVLRVEACAGF